MPYFNIVAQTSENTVVTEYEPVSGLIWYMRMCICYLLVFKIEKGASTQKKVKTPAGKDPYIYKNADEDLLSTSSSAFLVSVFICSKENC